MNRHPDKGPQQPDPKVAAQLTALINARIPRGHGFALLTFPMGPSVDAVMRYIGTGEREDVLVVMQHWLNEQRDGWGNAAAVKPTQWTTDRPTVPGLYVLKTDDKLMKEPEFLRLVDADGELQIHHWDGQQFDPTFDFVKELDPALHIWLGPIPEPWLIAGAMPKLPTEAQAEAALEGQSQRMAEHHVERCKAVYDAFLEAFPSKCRPPMEPGEEIPDSIKGLLQDAVFHGFAEGVAAQIHQPFPWKE